MNLTLQNVQAPSAELHVFRSDVGSHLFIVDGSRIYDVEAQFADTVEEWLVTGRPTDGVNKQELWTALGLFSASTADRYIDNEPLHSASALLDLVKCCPELQYGLRLLLCGYGQIWRAGAPDGFRSGQS